MMTYISLKVVHCDRAFVLHGFGKYTVFRKNTYLRFLLYLCGKFLDLHYIFRKCLLENKYFENEKVTYSLLSVTSCWRHISMFVNYGFYRWRQTFGGHNYTYYGAVLPRRRPHYVSMLSVCPVPPHRGKTKMPTNTKLNTKGPRDTSIPWTNFKVKGSKVKVTGHSSCVNVSLIIRISIWWLVDSRI